MLGSRDRLEYTNTHTHAHARTHTHGMHTHTHARTHTHAQQLTISSPSSLTVITFFLKAGPSTTRKFLFPLGMIPHFSAILLAVSTLSPVTIRTVIPAF